MQLTCSVHRLHPSMTVTKEIPVGRTPFFVNRVSPPLLIRKSCKSETHLSGTINISLNLFIVRYILPVNNTPCLIFHMCQPTGRVALPPDEYVILSRSRTINPRKHCELSKECYWWPAVATRHCKSHIRHPCGLVDYPMYILVKIGLVSFVLGIPVFTCFFCRHVCTSFPYSHLYRVVFVQIHRAFLSDLLVIVRTKFEPSPTEGCVVVAKYLLALLTLF